MDSGDDKELQCPICEADFTDLGNVPLMLPSCGHSICRPCL